MDSSDYFLEASLYYSKSVNPKRKDITFRRFVRAAEAIRFAVEELTPETSPRLHARNQRHQLLRSRDPTAL